MKVRLLYFAALREQLGTSGEELELPAEVTSVAGLRAHLKARGGMYEKALADKSPVRIAVNQEMAPLSRAIRAGDEIAFFPPVTGG